MGDLDDNFLLYLPDKLLLVNDRHLNNLLESDLIGHYFLNNLSNTNLFLLCISNKPRYFPIEIDGLPICNNIRHLPLNLNIAISLKQLLTNNLNLLYPLPHLLNIDRFLNQFLNLNIFFLTRYFDNLLDLDYFGSLYDDLVVVYYLDHFVLV